MMGTVTKSSVSFIPTSRWLSLTACVVMEAVAGSVYLFPVYSPVLKTQFHFTQDDIQNAGSLGNLGNYLSIIAGFCYDAQGPTVSLLFGAGFAGLGYGLLYGASAGLLPSTVSLVNVYCFLWGHGSAWLDTVAVSTSVKNFPKDKGAALGFLKSLFGLSASLLTLFYSTMFKPDVTSFLLFLCWLIPVVALVCGLFIRLIPLDDAEVPLTNTEQNKFAMGNVGVLSVAIYLSIIALLQNSNKITNSPVLAYVLIPMVIFTGCIVIVPCKRSSSSASDALKDKDEDRTANGNNSSYNINNLPNHSSSTTSSALPLITQGLDDSMLTTSSLLLDDHDHQHHTRLLSETDDDITGKSSSSPVALLPGATFMEALCTLDFWIWCVVLFSGTGSGLTVINNLGSLTKALGAATDGQDVYVVLLSVFNCLGRATFGYLSDKYAHKITRPGWCTIIVGGMGIAQIIMAFSDLNLLYAGVILTGFFYGGFWSVGPALLGDRYGMKAFAAVYGLSALWTALASYVLSATMASVIYTAHITEPNSTDCTAGKACYQTTFIILAILCGIGTLLGLYLVRRLKLLYNDNGTTIPYNIWKRTPQGNRTEFTRYMSRFWYPWCCCRWGRSLVYDSENDYENDTLDGEKDRRHTEPSIAFDGDVSMYTYKIGTMNYITPVK